MERDSCFNANTPGKQAALWLCLHLAMGLCARSEQRTKLITLCTVLVPDITFATPKANDYHQYHHLWPTSKQTCYYRYYFWKRYISIVLSVGHSWMISLGCPTGSSSPTCQFSVFQAQRSWSGHQDLHLTWNTGSGYSCLCNYLIYSGNKTILYLQMLAKLCYWNYTHTHFTVTWLSRTKRVVVIEIVVKKPEYTRVYLKWGS